MASGFTEKCVEEAIRMKRCKLSSTGALVAYSGEKTGRSPKDKRIVMNEQSKEIWWSDVNKPISKKLYDSYIAYARSYMFAHIEDVHVVDAYAGWDPKHRVGVRVYCCNPYHALFMKNMLIPVNNHERENFEAELIIYNVGHLSLDEVPSIYEKDYSLSKTLIALELGIKSASLVIYGTEYAGEMKKGVFTYMMWRMPLFNHLTLHSSANVSKTDRSNTTFFFGMSGTGKTALSTDSNSCLVGDDEHVWTDKGIFNIEGGCYAKCIGLKEDKEPEIFHAIRYGTVLENVVMDKDTRVVDYDDISITPNTRASYPLDFIEDSVIPAFAPHPKNIIFLACDASGLLPPVAKLTPEQATFFFISGYTSKIPGTEMGVSKPIPTFSACFGEPFLVWSPLRYGELLKQKLEKHDTPVYLLNTGWIEGGYGVGRRIPIQYSRSMVNAIVNGYFTDYEPFPVFDLEIPTGCPGVPSEFLNPLHNHPNPAQYLEDLQELYSKFQENYKRYN